MFLINQKYQTNNHKTRTLDWVGVYINLYVQNNYDKFIEDRFEAFTLPKESLQMIKEDLEASKLLNLWIHDFWYNYPAINLRLPSQSSSSLRVTFNIIKELQSMSKYVDTFYILHKVY